MAKIIVGNWKMHGAQSLGEALAREVAMFAAQSQSRQEIVICPPFTLLTTVHNVVAPTLVRLGAQDCHEKEHGAYTGSISAAMLKEAGCSYVILGHSERRQNQGETSNLVKNKALAAIGQGLTPVICIGETQAEHEKNSAEQVVAEQLQASMPDTGHFILAYEPVWAIGSGKIPTMDDIASMHALIARFAGHAKILYGGSVKADNAASIMQVPHVSGVLVGGASLKADEFCGIIAAADEV